MQSSDRMQRNSAEHVNEAIREETEERVRAVAGDPERTSRRLEELDREWDVERALFTLSGLNVLLGLALGHRVSPKWYGYVAVVGAFQVQHGIQGWCPPLAALRRLRLRTRREIDDERTALKALRGDFGGVPSPGSRRADEATRAAVLDAARS
jgi:hypothetical protein